MPKKILVVDDEPDMVTTLSSRLRSSGYEVISASDEEGCFEKARDEKPDLVLLDVILPGAGGFAVCRRLKEDPRTGHIPVIMITALIGESAKEEGLKSGAAYVLSKPFDPEDLLWAVDSALKKKYKGK